MSLHLPKFTTQYILTDEEIAIARDLGVRRHAWEVANERPNNKMTRARQEGNPEHDEIMSAGSEIAMAQIAGVEYDTKVPGQSGYDVTIEGLTINIKWTELWSGKLMVPRKHGQQPRQCDGFILMYGWHLRQFFFHGWTAFGAVVNDVYWDPTQRWPCWVMEKDDPNLYPWGEGHHLLELNATDQRKLEGLHV
jgi:hypothetical protein